jgi:peptidoglycan/LPS O-acetylase OafA/YrhL
MNGIVTAPKPSGRLSTLDGLRGLAALLVVFYHMGWPNHLTTNNFVGNGYLAVDLFFILSGFVIFQNYAFRIGSINDFRNFIYLRFFRVYPLHLAILAWLSCVELLKLLMQGSLATPSEQVPFSDNNSIPALVANILLLQGLHTLQGLSWNIPSWSISCEFAAYLLFGVAALTGLIRQRLFFSGILLAAACAYVILSFEYNGLDVTYDWGGVRCLAGFFLGAMLAHVNRPPSDSQAQPWISGATVVTMIAIIAVMSAVSGPAVLLVVPFFVIAIALLRIDRGPVARILMLRSIQYLGRVSYSIYMVQFPTIVGLKIVLKRLFKVSVLQDPITQRFTLTIDPWVGDILVLVSVLAVLLIAGGTYAWIESPGRAFGRRLVAQGRDLHERSLLTAKLD